VSIFEGPPGSTPLEPEDQEGLRPTWIATRGDLNVAEQENVARATMWARGRRWDVSDLSPGMLRDLHRRMFDDVWRWAGTYRKHDTNLGVPWVEVAVAVATLIEDLHAQIEEEAWPADEIAIRLHHRLVSIHPFPNGNGRHGRLATDIVCKVLGAERFSWGAGAELVLPGAARNAYLDALHRADGGDIAPLMRFART
jgi:Fic-DOC domain mobile mystery protein B